MGNYLAKGINELGRPSIANCRFRALLPLQLPGAHFVLRLVVLNVLDISICPELRRGMSLDAPDALVVVLNVRTHLDEGLRHLARHAVLHEHAHYFDIRRLHKRQVDEFPGVDAARACLGVHSAGGGDLLPHCPE